MSTAIYSVKVAALKGTEIKLTVRALVDDAVAFCPILALRLLHDLGASGPADEAYHLDPRATPGDVHALVAGSFASARSTASKASVTWTLQVRDPAWLGKIKKGDSAESTAYAAPTRRVGAEFSANGSVLVAGRDTGDIEAHAVTQKKGRAALGKLLWSTQHLGLLALTLLDKDILVTAGRSELRAHQDGEATAEVQLAAGAKVTALAPAGARVLVGFEDGSVASWQPGKDKSLVRIGEVGAPVVGLAALAKDALAVSTAAEVVVFRKGAIASRVKSAAGTITALARGPVEGGFAYGTTTGLVVCFKADGTVAREHQSQVEQEFALGLTQRDGHGALVALARRGNRLFVATIDPAGLRLAGPLDEVEQFSSSVTPDGIVARVNEKQVLLLTLDGTVRWRQELPDAAMQAAQLSPPGYEPRATRDGNALILGFAETQKASELRDRSGAVLARENAPYGHYFQGAIPLGRDAGLAWFSSGGAYRLTASGSEKLPLKVHGVVAIESTGGAFALVTEAAREEEEEEEGKQGRLVELDAMGREIAVIATIPADDVRNSTGLLASDNGALFSAEIPDSKTGDRVTRCWKREGDKLRTFAAPWGSSWPTFSADGARVAWEDRDDKRVVLHDIDAGRELARVAFAGYWCPFQFDGVGRLVLQDEGKLRWFDAAGAPCGEQDLPGKDLVKPPVTRLLTCGEEPELVVVTTLDATVLGVKGKPDSIRDPSIVAASDSFVAAGSGWALGVRTR